MKKEYYVIDKDTKLLIAKFENEFWAKYFINLLEHGDYIESKYYRYFEILEIEE